MKAKLLILAFIYTASIYGQTPKEERIQCGGVERWSEKVLVDGAVNTINFTPIGTTITNLINIATPTPTTTMPRQSGIEDKTYSVVCNITIKKDETDNDFHLVLSDGVNTLIGEVPDPTCSAASSSSYVSQFINARNFINTNIPAGNVFIVNLPPVIVYGVAFIDPPHGQTGAAANNLEIHPILDIQFYTPTGIKMNTEILKVYIFPNPIKDKLNIQVNSKIDDLSNCSFKIYNLLGSIVKTINLPKSGMELNHSFSIEDLKSGLYLYKLFNKEHIVYEGKLIKE